MMLNNQDVATLLINSLVKGFSIVWIKYCLVLITLFFPIINKAQTYFSDEKIITSWTEEVEYMFIADIDSDGDMDILASSPNYYKIIWFENIDGKGTFSTSKLIGSSIRVVGDVCAGDLDGDSDMDVLFDVDYEYKTGWFQNLDGKGNFSARKNISTEIGEPQYISTADLNGDGDLDVLVNNWYYDEIVWYENTDGKGTFGMKQNISNTTGSAKLSVTTADLDGDYDLDILFNEDNQIAWYENTNGDGSIWTKKIIVDYLSSGTAKDTYSGDIDGDGDMDVISSVKYSIVWYENIDGKGNFSESQTILYPFTGDDIFPSDIDGDGDLDILYTYSGAATQWLENTDGVGTFGVDHKISYLGGYEVRTADIDNDGRLDVVVSDPARHRILWFHNEMFQILSCTRQEPHSEYTNSDQLIFRITFNKDVHSVDISDFVIDGTSTATVTNVSVVSNYKVYDVTVSGGDLADFNGKTGLNLSPNQDIKDKIAIKMPTAEPPIDETYILDNILPEISCLSNQTKNITNGASFYTVSGTELDPVSSSDYNSIDTIKNNFNDQSTLNFAQFLVGTTDVIWTAIDKAGNSSTCSFDVIVNDITGFQDLTKSGLSIYPNPTKGFLKIECNQNSIKDIKIIDFSGRVVIDRTKNTKSETMDISGLENCVYIVNIQINTEFFSFKLVKE